MSSDPHADARAAADRLRALGWPSHDVLVTLGSGWRSSVDSWGAPEAVAAMRTVPGFQDPAAIGHVGEIRSYAVGGRRVLVYLGRTHLYEGHGPTVVVHGVRTAAALGCRVAILTNANGSLRAGWPLGTILLVRDHLNLTGSSPIQGATFVDLTDAYSARLRDLARTVDPTLAEGVYAMLTGPHYETRAEALALMAVGADLVGMSTALETIAAREAGMEVLALSVVTAVEGSDSGIDADEVIRIAADATTGCGATIGEVIKRL